MVRTIDGTARRRALAEAVWRIVQRDGLAAASVRSVARETELSTGSVRHFFGTQAELIAFAMHELVDTVGERIRASAEIADPAERAARMVGEMMPLTDASHAEAAAFFEFVSRARLDRTLEPIATESFARIHAVCVHVVELLVSAGTLPAAVDVDASARALWALVDGLTVQLLYAPALVTREAARATVRTFLQEGIRT